MEELTLSGFGAIDTGAKHVAERMSINHADKLKKRFTSLENVHITLKTIHEREKSEKYVLHGKLLLGGKVIAVETDNRNLFMALDDLFSKLTTQADHV